MRKLILALMTMVGFAGCSTSHSPARASKVIPPYTRIANPDSNTVELQIAVRKFLPAHHGGPAVLLAAVMHVGQPEYYRALQGILDKQTVVLYEGINPSAHKRHMHDPQLTNDEPAATAANVTATNSGFSMQSALASSLGLVFQLDAIDYDRTNFLNSDLSVDEIQRIIAGNGTSTNGASNQTSASFDALLQVMDGSSFIGSLVKLGMQFIGSNPKLQALTKLALIETVGSLKGDLSDIHGMPPDLKQLVKVLIEARNKNVVNDLKDEVKLLPRSGSIAIFYGAGHMDDLQRRLEKLHYRVAGETWLSAFSVNTQASGVTPVEMQAMRSLIKWQLGQMTQ